MLCERFYTTASEIKRTFFAPFYATHDLLISIFGAPILFVLGSIFSSSIAQLFIDVI